MKIKRRITASVLALVFIILCIPFSTGAQSDILERAETNDSEMDVSGYRVEEKTAKKEMLPGDMTLDELSNTSILTVSSSGVIASNTNTGTCRITATHKTYTHLSVYVDVTVTGTQSDTIPDGVYRIICNLVNRPLTVYDFGYTNFSNVKVKSENHDNDFSQLWRVASIGGGYYSIRPLNKPNMGLDVTGTNVDIYSIGISDSLSIITSARWQITESPYNNEYYIQNYTYADKTLTCSGSDFDAYVDTFYGHADQRWLFEPVSVDDKISIYGDSYLTVGSSTLLTAGVFSSETLNQSVTWSCSYANVTVSSNGTVIADAPGFACIRADSTIDSTCFGLFDIYIGSYEDKSVGLVGIPATDHNHTDIISTLTGSSYLGGIYNISNIVTVTTAMNEINFKTLAAAAYVTVIRSHGSQTKVQLNESPYDYCRMTYEQGRPLTKSDLILYMSCSCGEGGRNADNLVNYTFKAGAKNVIGFTGDIDCQAISDPTNRPADEWLKYFWNYLRTHSGATYQQAINHANSEMPYAAEHGFTSYLYRSIDEQ